MSQLFDPALTGLVIKEWEVMYPDPIEVQAGESITVGEEDPEWPGWKWCTDIHGRGGWIPIDYIEQHSPKGQTIASDAYTSRELAISVGEKVKLHKMQSGWYWASNQKGDQLSCKTDGRILKWKSLGVKNQWGQPPVEPIPFFIQWAADSLHPSQDSPKGCELQSFETQYPDPSAVTELLKKLGIDATVTRADNARLKASLKTPKGLVDLT